MSTDVLLRPASDRRAAQPAADRTAVLLAPVAKLLAAHSITVLRVALGAVFLGFGVLKFFPGLSPAADIAQRTIGALTFGVVGPTAALLLTAVLECVIGLTLLTGRFLKVGLLVLAGALVGIMSPIVLFFHELFPHGPSLLGQYVLKDLVLAAAGMVVAAWALGARLRTPEE